MCRYFVIFACCFAASFSLIIVNPGPKFPPTRGEVWPLPQRQNKSDDYYVVNLPTFRIEITGESCSILKKAVARYKGVVTNMKRLLHTPTKTDSIHAVRNLGTTETLRIQLLKPCEEYPHLDMDESYSLNTSETSLLSSSSIWGILRGMESYSQSLYYDDDFTEVRVNKTAIIDFPVYSHRGLLLDTSRHYVSIRNIIKTIDAMAYNKLNVFHWHIVDDQSFPYASDLFPELSRLGAFYKTAVYTTDNIRRIVNYARDRGVRVIPEIDIPGHVRSWGEAYPKLLTECYDNNKLVGLGPLNPLDDGVYSMLQNLLQEVCSLFPDQYLHLGGDEVDQNCWKSNPKIQEYMKEHNTDDYNKLFQLFMDRVRQILPSNTSRTVAVWHDVVESNVVLRNNSLVQVWRNDNGELARVLKKGYHVLYSECWYLDHLQGGGDWEDFYKCDPQKKVTPSFDTDEDTDGYMEERRFEDAIVGGEGCMWGEVIDDANVISRVWPRASAIAERLWSNPELPNRNKVPNQVRARLEEQTCRMKRRGIAAQPPNGPGYCRLV